MPIRSFADGDTEALFYGLRVKRIGPAIAGPARRKLAVLNGAVSLGDLASPGADLKPLEGEQALWQMRVNRQYRIRFRVVNDAPLEVEDVWFGDPH